MIGIKLIQIIKMEIMNMDIEKNEFDSEFSNVRYMSEDNVVFLTWKKFSAMIIIEIQRHLL